MATDSFGAEGMSDDDRAYKGSRFSEVRAAVFENPYQKPWGREGEPALPITPVSLGDHLRGILPFMGPFRFRQAAERAIDSHADLRWGKDGLGYRRLLHPNGVCLTGKWRITKETTYSGYFGTGSEALIIGRYSTCCSETRRGHIRSLALVGKLYPTTDPNHADLLRTANFITQQDIAGDRTDYINDVELRNAADVTAWRRGFGVPTLMVTGAVFKRVDKEPAHRQLYPVAELGQGTNQKTRAPQFMRLLVAPDQPRIEGAALDFRDEVMAQIYDKGESKPKRTLTFHIEVTDDGVTRGPTFRLRRTFTNWRHIGEIVFKEATASRNGDCVLHFNHPTWRKDRNDPATATRVGERKVR